MSKKAGTALSVMAMVFMGALASPLTVLVADAEGDLSACSVCNDLGTASTSCSDHPCADHKKKYTVLCLWEL